MSRFLLPLLLMFLLSPSAHAQCTMPSGQPDANAGVILFNNDHKVMQYCNGEKWVGLWGGGGTGLPACGDGQIVQQQSGVWACNNGSGIDNLNASNLKSGTVPTARLGTGSASATTFLRGDNSWQTFVPIPPSCAGNDKALQWDSGAWACVTLTGIGGGGSSNDLVYNIHSSADCTAAGGTVITEGAHKMCRFSGASCPSGWIALLNWSTAQAYNSGCTAQGHAWSNQALKTCIYTTTCQSGVGDSVNYYPCSHTVTATRTQIGCY